MDLVKLHLRINCIIFTSGAALYIICIQIMCLACKQKQFVCVPGDGAFFIFVDLKVSLKDSLPN